MFKKNPDYIGFKYSNRALEYMFRERKRIKKFRKETIDWSKNLRDILHPINPTQLKHRGKIIPMENIPA